MADPMSHPPPCTTQISSPNPSCSAPNTSPDRATKKCSFETKHKTRRPYHTTESKGICRSPPFSVTLASTHLDRKVSFLFAYREQVAVDEASSREQEVGSIRKCCPVFLTQLRQRRQPRHRLRSFALASLRFRNIKQELQMGSSTA